MGFKNIRSPKSLDAIDHHSFALTIENAEWKALLKAAARNDLIYRVFSEVIGPRFEIIIVDIMSAVDDQRLNCTHNVFWRHVVNRTPCNGDILSRSRGWLLRSRVRSPTVQHLGHPSQGKHLHHHFLAHLAARTR